MVEYAARLQKKYGYQVIEELLAKSRIEIKLSTQDLIDQIEVYKQKLLSLNS
jgi:hypothetical protein